MSDLNIRDGIPDSLPEELVETLAKGRGVRIERIVSRGHQSPEGFWYDQDEHEWVMLVAGSAVLEIEGRGDMSLSAGDYLLLPAHGRHRVKQTSPDTDTIWLAVFFDGSDAP